MRRNCGRNRTFSPPHCIPSLSPPTRSRSGSKTRLLNFLMRLRPEFEAARSTLLNRDDLRFEGLLSHLVREEIRIRTQANIDVRPSAGETIFAVAGQESAYSVNRPSFNNKPMSNDIECHFCHERGHPKKHCRQWNVCVYCKRAGHIILECRTRQRNEARAAGGGLDSSSRPERAGGGPAGRFFNPRTSRPPPGDRTAHATALAPGNGQQDIGSSSGGSVSATDIENMVNAALQRSLPTAISAAFATLNNSGNTSPWLLDSACFNHMTNASRILNNVTPVKDMSLSVANGGKLEVQGVGLMRKQNMTLPSTLYVPGLVPNLVSVGQLTEQGCSVLFAPSGCVIQDLKTGRQIGKGSKQGRVFHLDELRGSSVSSSAFRSCVSSPPLNSLSLSKPISCDSAGSLSFSTLSNNAWDLWHSRLGHPHSGGLEMMFRQSLLGKNHVNPSASHSCTSCVEAKTVNISYPSSTTVITDPFHIIHTDLWGPSPTISRRGYRYFALFIDHATRFTWVYFLRLKSELKSVATDFLKMIQTQFDRPVKIIRSDPGGEFSSAPLYEVYRSLGVLTRQSCPGISQQNGLVERKNRHVMDLTRALLLASHVPSRFWPEAVATAVRLINYQITPVLRNTSPFFALYSRHPDYSRLRVFGCLCFVLLPKRERTKLTSKTARCVFLGYSDIHKGYLCYDPVVQRVRIASTVVFFENSMFYSPGSSPSDFLPANLPPPTFADDVDDDFTPAMNPPDPPSPNLSPATSDAASSSTAATPPSPITLGSSAHSSASLHTTLDTSASSSEPHSSSQPTQPAPRRSERVTRGVPPPKFGDYLAYGVESIVVPTRYRQAKGHPLWEAAMHRELEALHASNTWTLVPRPPSSTSVVGCRWVYTVKMKPDGTVDRYKARLVAQGYT
ncbi:unnamed protein product [Linum trigynum]|uniref:Integrase catalytic domain-containing protein n=1 Tax=Linum trigynum TaxID=586398 RepID=A0AAV2E024_9ROSI